MIKLNKIWKHRHDFRNIFQSLYFNFHYLPFKTAIKLPILLYKPKLLELQGSVKIVCEKEIKYGMIRLGFPTVSLYPDTGITIENHGGEIIFNGTCSIGNNSYISIGKKGKVEFGDKFIATTTFRLTSYDKIVFGERVIFGWDILVMDTDFHKLTKLSGGYSKGHASIFIGSNNWFGNGCKIMKRTQTPDYCVISAGTILSGKIDVPEYCVIGNEQKVVVKTAGVWRNIDDDSIDY